MLCLANYRFPWLNHQVKIAIGLQRTPMANSSHCNEMVAESRKVIENQTFRDVLWKINEMEFSPSNACPAGQSVDLSWPNA